MNSIYSVFRSVSLVLMLLVLAGCISVPEPQRLSGASSPSAAELRRTAFLEFDRAADVVSVDRTIQALEKALNYYPDDCELLERLSNLYIFKGAALEHSVKQKRVAFVKALYYAEAAMMTSPEFAAQIKDGKRIWDAVAVLDKNRVGAMSFWSTALFYQFDECMNKMVKPFNLRWVRRAEQVLARAYALDPDWGGGQLHFSYGIYYLMPAMAGGDMEKSERCFKTAVEVGPNWLINRWGRARYFYRKNGNKDAFASDLNWVLSQDAKTADGPLFWNLYCQRDAAEMLKKMK